MTGVFVKPKYLVFMRNVMKYLGIMSVSLACAGPLFATSVQPFAGVTVVQQSVVTVKGQVVDEKGEPITGVSSMELALSIEAPSIWRLSAILPALSSSA